MSAKALEAMAQAGQAQAADYQRRLLEAMSESYSPNWNPSVWWSPQVCAEQLAAIFACSGDWDTAAQELGVARERGIVSRVNLSRELLLRYVAEDSGDGDLIRKILRDAIEPVRDAVICFETN